MNDTPDPKPAADTPWRHSDGQAPVPHTSMLPGSEKPAPAAVGLLKQAVRGAHDGIDRLADSAEPTVRQLGERVAAAESAVQAQAVQLREVRDEWLARLRHRVRSQPLAALAVAAGLGALLARISR